MSDTSPVLSLPLLQPSQAQKHVTHNEALLQLEALVQLAVQDRDQTLPPSLPATGQRHIVGPQASGDWEGQDHAITWYDGVVWRFTFPQAGWRAEVVAEDATVVFDGTLWQQRDLNLNNVDAVGINTTADNTNRLAVASPEVLLTHDGADHRLKINKASAADTASLLYQTGFSGRAEIGLNGNDDLSIKVSADGNVWTTALGFDPATGLANGTAIQANATDITSGRLMRADYGYGPGNLVGTVSQTGGVPTGAAMESGSNANGTFTRMADGTQICAHQVILGPRNAIGGGTYDLPYRTEKESWTYPAPFASIGSVTATGEVDTTDSVDRASSVSIKGAGLIRVSTIQVAMASSSNTDASVIVHLLAFGRWY